MERIKEDRPITIKDDKGNLNRCIADVVSVRSRGLGELGGARGAPAASGAYERSGGPTLPAVATVYSEARRSQGCAALTHTRRGSSQLGMRGGQDFLPGQHPRDPCGRHRGSVQPGFPCTHSSRRPSQNPVGQVA